MSSRSSNMLSPKFPYSQNGFAARHGSMLDYSRGGDEPQLLDNFPNAAAAYSLRKIKAGVTSVVRVRRSSDNAEQDFTADDITGGALAAFCGAGDGFATTWYDQSGNGMNVTQAVAGTQPQIVSSGTVVTFGGLPALDTYNAGSLHFDGLDLTAESYTDATGLCVYQLDGNTNASVWNLASGAASSQLHPFSSNGYYYCNFFATTRPGLFDNTFNGPDYYLFWIQNLAGSMTAYTNNTIAGSAAVTFGMPANISQIPSPGNAVQGTVQEVIVWGEDKSADRGAIQSDINAYYSIY